MTNSVKVLNKIETLAALSGTVEKKNFLKEHLVDDELFRMVITWALDPMITYGVKDLSFLEEAYDKAKFEDDERKRRTLSVDDYHASSFVRVLKSLQNRRSTGNTAKTAIKGIAYDYDIETTELLMMILSKDIRAGVGVSTVNKAVPGTLFEFNVMLAAKLEPDKIQFPVYVEPKYDGMRLLAIGDHDGFEFYTRTGKKVDTVSPATEEALVQLYTFGTDIWFPKSKMVFDGELMGSSFRDTMKQARKKGHVYEDGVYYVFDAICFEEFQSLKQRKAKTQPYHERRKNLANVFLNSNGQFEEGLDGIELPPAYLCRNEDEMMEFYLRFRNRGLEGAIVKNPQGAYHPRRNRDWMKIKDSASVDVPIVDAIEGTGKYEGVLGALVVDVEGINVNIGTGFSDSDRKEIWESWGQGWLKDKVIEVEYHEKTPDGSLRHPRFKCFRNDKSKECGVGV